jgi:YHS domain-containing protein
MAGWILKLILLIIVIRAILRLVNGVVEGMRGPRDVKPPAVPLARDPVCGTYVVPSRALSGGSGADIRFFCSEKCRRAYEAKSAR